MNTPYNIVFNGYVLGFVAEKAVAEKTIKAQIVDLAVALKVRENPPVMETIKKYTPDGGLNTNGITDETKLVALKTELEDMLAKQEASVEDTQAIRQNFKIFYLRRSQVK